MLEFKYDTQRLIDGDDLDEDEVYDYFVEHRGSDQDSLPYQRAVAGTRVLCIDRRDLRYCRGRYGQTEQGT